MTHVSDIKFTKLRALGYVGALADMSAQYKADNGITRWSDWYASQGILEPHVSDAALQFWTTLVVP